MLRIAFSGLVLAETERTIGGGRIVDFPTQKMHALFVYLGLTQGQHHSRRTLAALFWPNTGEAAAANSLRQAIHHIRTLLTEAQVDPSVLHANAQHLALAATAAVTIDSQIVEQTWRQCRTHVHREVGNCTICARRMAQAAGLIAAAPLAALPITGAPEFELWLASEQERIMASARPLLQALASYHSKGGELETASGYVRQWLMIEPWQEEAHYLAVRLLAAQGKRPDALRQYQLCVKVLQTELGIGPEARLQEAHAQIAAGNLPSLPVPQLHNAPFRPSVLWGRQAEWHRLEAMLNDPANRVITILGPGGAGKSQLALVASQAVARLFRDGAWYVNLETIGNQTHFHAELANALGIAVSAGELLENQLLQYLARRDLLLLLDGSERLQHVAPFLARLVQRCTGITVIVTSRIRLHLRTERVLELEGLRVPATLAGRSSDADDSVTHFVDAARRLKPDFTLAAENGSAVLDICQLLEGLPLAIELAAAQLAVRSCPQLARELRCNLDLAAERWFDAPPRQRSLRASFEASWQHIDVDLQQLLSSLAVFEGAYTAEAAASVAAATIDSVYSRTGVESQLQRLIENSLLRRTVDDRYSLHTVVQAYALEHLAANPEQSPHSLRATRAAHLRYFAAWLQAHDPSHAGAQQKQYLDEIDVENRNLAAAWAYAVAERDWRTIDSMAPALQAASMIRGRSEEYAQLLDSAIDALHNQALPEGCLTTEAGQVHCQVLAHLCMLRALTANHMSDIQAARMHAAEAVRCLQLIRSEHVPQRTVLEAACCSMECVLAITEGNWAVMEAAAQQGLELLATVDDSRLRGLLLSYLGLAAGARGDYELAIRSHQAGIALLSGPDGDPWHAARQRANLAQALLVVGQIDPAVSLLHDAYTYFYQAGDLFSAAFILEHQAYPEIAVHGNAEAATNLCLQALELLRQTGMPGSEAAVLCSLGEIALMAANPRGALDYLAAAVRLAAEFHLTTDMLTPGTWLAIALLQLGQHARAAERYIRNALKSPLLETQLRDRLQEALDSLPVSPAGDEAVVANMAEDVDWWRASTALADLAVPHAAGLRGTEPG